MGFLRLRVSGLPARLPHRSEVYLGVSIGRRSYTSSNFHITSIRAKVDEFIQAKKVELNEFQATNPPDRADIENLLTQLIKTEISDTTPFTLLGLDGLDEVELVLTIESMFGITLSDAEFHSIHSISDAVRVVSKSTSTHSKTS